jgi:hypothetical protein
MQSLAWFPVWAIQENDGPHHFIADESGGLQRVGRSWQVLLCEEQVDIPGIADGTIIDRCHPGRDGISTDDRVRNLRLAQRLASSIQSFLNEFHGAKHPFENIETFFTNHTGEAFGIHPKIVARTGSKTGFLVVCRAIYQNDRADLWRPVVSSHTSPLK